MAKILYDDFFKLNENPFGETPDPRFYFASRTHQAALASLLQSIQEGKGFTLLTGEVGMGKTLVSRILLESTASHADSALILYPNCTDAELIHSICRELELPSGNLSEQNSGHKPGLDRLNEFLLTNARNGRKTILLIDEAQNMPTQTLETLRLLSNLETNNRKLIHTVLCAQPEFLKRLSEPNLRQLEQRIGAKIKLECLGANETEAYIKHRIECAGGSNFVRFDAEACAFIQKTAHGLPRNINRICDQLISHARNRGVRLISKALAREILEKPARQNWLRKVLRSNESTLA